MHPPETGHWRRVYLAVAATTAATILAELALTRIFSVVLFYHFAFLAISLSLFGLGAGGIFSYHLHGRSEAFRWRRLGLLSLSNLPVTTAALAIVLRQQVHINLTASVIWKLTLIYMVSAAPFFLAGVVVATAVSATVARVDRVYFFDLAGAAAGCLLLVPSLNFLGGPNTVMAAGVLYALAAAIWFDIGGLRHRAAIALIAAVLAFVFIGANTRTRWLDVHFAKGLALDDEAYSRWNSFSRVAVKVGPQAEPRIVIDGDAATGIPGYALEDLDERRRGEILDTGPGLVYRIRPGAKTLVIGPGGGYDVLRALASGSTDVTGAEINPIIVDDIMKERFAAASHRLYFDPRVNMQVAEGRSFIRRSRDQYQVIQMTLVDTWAATASGAFALSENNLYTIEAFRDYLGHLTGDGLLSITRWEFLPPRESLRVVSLAIEALRLSGAPEPSRNVLIVAENPEDLTTYGSKHTVIVKKSPFIGEELQRAAGAIARGRLHRVYMPGTPGRNLFAQFLTSSNPWRFARAYRYDITPVGDDRPFFFYTVRNRELWNYPRTGRAEDLKVNLGVVFLFILLGASLLATAIILVLPAVLLRARVPRESATFLHLAYFFAIGVGFIIVEVALIQKFVLFLGRPTYSLTVVVFSLLIATGLGSYRSRLAVGLRPFRLAVALGLAAALVTLLGLIAPLILEAGVGWPLPLKCAVTVILLLPAGLAMGTAFPSGLRRLEECYPGALQWAWAVNSAASVLGSVLAIFLAMNLGLTRTLLTGALCYVIALALVAATRVPVPVREGAAVAP